MPQPPLTIGRLGKAAEVNVETTCYDQRVGLVVEAVKLLEGFRVYPGETINQIRFIKCAQKLGFSFQDIAHLLELGEGQCNDVRFIAIFPQMNREEQVLARTIYQQLAQGKPALSQKIGRDTEASGGSHKTEARTVGSYLLQRHRGNH